MFGKKIIISIGILGLCIGCGSASMHKRTYDSTTGKLLTEDEVKVRRLGSGSLTDTEIGLKTGKARIGSREGDIGGMGTIFEKALDKIPNQ